MSTVKILLIDDDEDDFILTKDILRENDDNKNYELSWCNNFSEAINAMLKGHYDVYLVDYRLGKDSGIDLLNEAIKSNCAEPIIILTGKGDKRIDQEAMRLGAADYLVKDNISGQTLERSIRYAIAQNKNLQRLKSSEKKFRIIFERSKDPMLITNSEGDIIEANTAAIDFFDTTLTELQKVNASTLYKSSNDRDAYVNAMTEGGYITDLEVELQTRNGKGKFCSISSFLQVSQHANEELYYSIIHDLTYRLQQEREGALEEKLESTERIAKSLSKEIQNPLSNVNLAIDELFDELSNEEHLILLDIIKTNCGKINELTAELIESTELVLPELSKIDLASILSGLVDNARQDFDISIQCQKLESPIILNANEKDILSAFRNIIQNASEAIVPGSEEVNIKLQKSTTSLRIEISDNGTGISNENIEKVFEPFFTTKAKSVGLGLTRAQRIINAHQGKIHIVSQPGAGTKVSITLPYKSGGL